MYSETELLQIGTGYLDTGKYEKAIAIFTKALEINPHNGNTYENRAIAWFRIYDIENALNDISKAIDLDIENHNAWFNKGEILRHKKQYKEAQLCYQHANNIYPGSLSYLTGLIQTSAVQKKNDTIIQYCNQILKDVPNDNIALQYRGMAYSNIKDYNAAIKDYLKLVNLGKRSWSIYNNLGFWFSKIGELKKASNNLTVALQFNPNHPYVLNNLGNVKYLEADYRKALELINSSLEIDPSNSYAYKNRALVYIKTGEKDQALKDLEKSLFLGYRYDYNEEVDALLKAEFNIG